MLLIYAMQSAKMIPRYWLSVMLEDGITKVIKGLYNLLARVKEEVSLSKAELETIASKDETIASLCRQNIRLDKEMGELVDKYNRIKAKAERLEKERYGFRTLVESKNRCIRETYFILFDNIEPRSLEKLGDLGLRQLIGKESWEKLKHLDDISMSQSIKKGPRL